MDGYESRLPLPQRINDGTPDCINNRPAGYHRPARHRYRQRQTSATPPCSRPSNAVPVVCNIAHFDNEIDTRLHAASSGAGNPSNPRSTRCTAATTRKDYLILLSEGRLVNLGQRHRPTPPASWTAPSPTRCWPRCFSNERKFADLSTRRTSCRLTRSSPTQAPGRRSRPLSMVQGFGGASSPSLTATAGQVH